MFILRDLLTPLQQEFSTTAQGQRRSVWFVYTLLAVVVPFTSSMTSNLLRALHTLFGLTIQRQRFYAFMASTTLPWSRLWRTLWGLIPDAATEGRVLVAVDDSINPKSGKKIFACGHFHQHALKDNQSSYPWSQCIVAIGLLKQVKSRWACLDFHLLSRLRTNIILYDLITPLAKGDKPKRGRPRKYGERLGSVEECATGRRQQAQTYSVFLYGKQREVQAYSQVVMLKTMKCPVRVVWVFRKTRYVALMTTDLALSIEQIIEYYGARWKIEAGFKEIKQEIGSAKTQTRNPQAVINHLNFCMMATTLTWVYADRLAHAPDRRHKIRGRSSFAFSDVRRIVAEVALDPDFQSVCPGPTQTAQNSFVKTLLRMVA